MAKILVIDDEEMIRFAFAEFLKDDGHLPLLATDAATAFEQIINQQPEIIFLDYRLPGKDGLEIIAELRERLPEASVVFMTAFGAMDVAIKAMQRGAYEYLTKPLDLVKIRGLIQRILAGKKALKERAPNNYPESEAVAVGPMAGQSPAIQEVFKMIGLLTAQDVTVLITGESGVGKELVARAIHDNSSRCAQPFIAINCGAMPEGLLEAELFGHEKGAFTGADSQSIGKFEAAGEGTIFLDEIGEMQLALQVKLLRVLQEKAFTRVGGTRSVVSSARIIAATNKDLSLEIAEGRFRPDLFYRLQTVCLPIPPLRQRKEDIPLLVEHLIRKINAEMGRSVQDVTGEALQMLQDYSWPGNVRELENQIRRAMIVCREDALDKAAFQVQLKPSAVGGLLAQERLVQAVHDALAEILLQQDGVGGGYEMIVSRVEKTLIEDALQRTSGNQMQAAALLGLHRSTLRKKIRDYLGEQCQ